MTRIIREILKDVQNPKEKSSSGNFARGMGKVISLNAQTDFRNQVASLRLSEKSALTKDARRIGQDMWDILEG